MDSPKSYVVRKTREKASKRRRIADDESESSLKYRKALFLETWKPVQKGIDIIVQEATSRTLSEVEGFLAKDAVPEHKSDRVAVGLLSSGHGSALRDVLFGRVRRHVLQSGVQAYASLAASDGSNLKTLLKSLIKNAIAAPSRDPPNLEALPAAPRGRLLDYDLQILYDWCKARSISSVVVAFPDGETIDAGLLSDLLSLMKSWRDRLRFTLLLGIGSSVENFCERLPRTASRLMRCQVINNVAGDSLVQSIYRYANHNRQAKLRLGPALSEVFLRRQTSSIHLVESFIQSIKYAYMCHFHGNSLSILLKRDLQYEDLDPSHCEALRNLHSFQRHAEDLLEQKHPAHVRRLLESNEALFIEIKDSLETTNSSLVWMMSAASVLHKLMRLAGISSVPLLSTLTINALSGNTMGSTEIRNLLLHIKRASSDTLSKMLSEVQDTLITMPPSDIEVSPDAFADIAEQLLDLLNRHKDDAKQPQVVAEGSTFRLPVHGRKGTSQKGAAPRHREQDIAYTHLITTFCESLESYFKQTLRDYRNLFLHEVFIYDLKSPHADIFGPKTRFAIERALSAPHDYLGCSCCMSSNDGLSATQPATALLYQLYLESGALINVHDLLSAFQAVVGDQYSESATMALFQRALAELKSMGFLKQSRKRIDHISKLAWKGL